MSPGRIKAPVDIPPDDLGEFFTVSSMRVCLAFSKAQIETAEDLGGGYTPWSVRQTQSFFRAQINEADAHGIGSAPWVMELASCLERIEGRVEAEDVSPSYWLRELRQFQKHLRAGLCARGCPEAKDLPYPSGADRVRD